MNLDYNSAQDRHYKIEQLRNRYWILYVLYHLIGSLSKDDGYGNENVSPKYNVARLSQVFRDCCSVLFTLYNTGKLSCNWMGTSGFKVKTKKYCILVICSRCRQNLKFGDFTLLFCGSTAEKCTEIRVARAARVFFPFLTNDIPLWSCRNRSK